MVVFPSQEILLMDPNINRNKVKLYRNKTEKNVQLVFCMNVQFVHTIELFLLFLPLKVGIFWWSR